MFGKNKGRGKNVWINKNRGKYADLKNRGKCAVRVENEDSNAIVPL